MVYLYLLYFFSGIIKTFLIYFGISLPIDFTFLVAVLIILSLIPEYFSGKINIIFSTGKIFPVFFICVFFLWIVISLLHTPSPVYSIQKTLFFTTNLIAFFVPLITNFNIRKFLKLFLLLLPVIAVLVFVTFFEVEKNDFRSDLYYNIKGLFLTVSGIAGIGFLIIVTSGEKIFNLKIINYLVAGILFFLIVLFGARGPLFFVIIVLLVFAAYKIPTLKISLKVTRNGILMTLTLILLVLTIGGHYIIKYYDHLDILLNRTFERSMLIIGNFGDSGSMGKSVDIRVDQFKFSLSVIFENFNNFLIGNGIGSFGIMESGIDGRAYPHNIILEIWFELGFFGVLLFLFFLISVFLRKIKNIKFISVFVLLYILLNMFKSYSIIDIRNYFTFFAFYIHYRNFKDIRSS